MADRPRFRLNSPQAIGETVDGEAIVVNLGTGTYYSIKGDSLALWEAIAAGATADEIAEVGAALTGESREAVVNRPPRRRRRSTSRARAADCSSRASRPMRTCRT